MLSLAPRARHWRPGARGRPLDRPEGGLTARLALGARAAGDNWR
jgi:hypothetical protein